MAHDSDGLRVLSLNQVTVASNGMDLAIIIAMALQHYTDSALVYLLEALYASPRAYSVTPSAVLAEIRRRAILNARTTTEERWS